MNDLMFVSEVAEYLRRSENTIRWMIYEGKAPRHAKVAGRIVFRKTDVDTWLDEQFEKELA